LSTLIEVQSLKIHKASGKQKSETRYFISSLSLDAEAFQEAVRGHWSIENNLHWMLDVAFGEDNSRKRAGHAAQNFSTLCKIVLNLLRQHDDKHGKTKVSMKAKRKKAGWNNDYLLAVLNEANKL